MDTDRQILIATLGAELQVVTLALLQAKGYAIAEVMALHTIGEAHGQP